MASSHVFYLHYHTSYKELTSQESASIEVTLQNVDSLCTPWQSNHLRMQDASLCYLEVRIYALSLMLGGQIVTASSTI